MWGLCRVLRLEHPALKVLVSEAAHGLGAASAARSLGATNEETEISWNGVGARYATRLRQCATPLAAHSVPLGGEFVVTGGLGGLGLRAAVLLAERGAILTLASRSGRVTRSGQGLEAQLESLRGAIGAVRPCDASDAVEVCLLFRQGVPRGVLHAAGAASQGLLATLRADCIPWAFGPKASGAWHLFCAATSTPLDAQLLFSSVGSGLGHVGQASYAASNASLDAHARTQRGQGLVACSVQWPLVGGAGMGASAIAALGARRMSGAATISMDQYGACLSSLLSARAGLGRTVQLVHSSEITRDVADSSQLRFTELPEQDAVAVTATPHASTDKSELSLALATLPVEHWVERQRVVEASVMHVVQEVGRASVSSFGPETELVGVGIDSLAATELAARLGSLTGSALSPTLAFEHRTPRALAAYLLAELDLVESSTREALRLSYQTEVYEPRSGGSFPVVVTSSPRGWVARPMRILFLHGQGTSSAFAHKMLKMRGWLEPQMPFEFVLPDGPHPVEAHTHVEAWSTLGLQSLVDSGIYDPSVEQRMWGARFDTFAKNFATRNPMVIARMRARGTPISEVIKEHGAFSEERWACTIEYLRDFIAAYGPFDGIGGFSEGAATAHILLHMQHTGIEMGLGSVRFCLALSPWISPRGGPASRALPATDARLPVRLLLTVGRRDLEMFQEAAPLFERDFSEVLLHEHEGEHVYPLVTSELRSICSHLVLGDHCMRGREACRSNAAVATGGLLALIDRVPSFLREPRRKHRS